MSKPAAYRGVFPVVPTVFDAAGALDLEGQLRAVDFMIDAGSEGLCILANFSEQFVLTPPYSRSTALMLCRATLDDRRPANGGVKRLPGGFGIR
jgi:dihydrodipicolinate synthase/N-acetylneuraminate lyase